MIELTKEMKLLKEHCHGLEDKYNEMQSLWLDAQQ